MYSQGDVCEQRWRTTAEAHSSLDCQTPGARYHYRARTSGRRRVRNNARAHITDHRTVEMPKDPSLTVNENHLHVMRRHRMLWTNQTESENKSSVQNQYLPSMGLGCASTSQAEIFCVGAATGSLFFHARSTSITTTDSLSPCRAR